MIQTAITAVQLPRQPTHEESDDQLLSWVASTVRSFAQHWNASYSKITDHLAFAPTPSDIQISQGLVKVGFKSVIGMESKQNPGEYLSNEAALWKASGIDFVSYPFKVLICCSYLMFLGGDPIQNCVDEKKNRCHLNTHYFLSFSLFQLLLDLQRISVQYSSWNRRRQHWIGSPYATTGLSFIIFNLIVLAYFLLSTSYV